MSANVGSFDCSVTNGVSSAPICLLTSRSEMVGSEGIAAVCPLSSSPGEMLHVASPDSDVMVATCTSLSPTPSLGASPTGLRDSASAFEFAFPER